MLQSIASDVADNYGATQVNLVLDDADKAIVVSAAEADIFWRWADTPTALPELLGTATIGEPFSVPFTFEPGREVELFAVARSATGEQATTNPLNGVTTRYLPNLELLTPTLTLAAATTNTVALVNITNYTVNSRYRRIKFSSNSDMSSAAVTEQDATNYPNSLLPAQITLSKASEASAVNRYCTVEHSSNQLEWGEASATLTILYADSGGSGGGGSTETPPTITSAVWNGTTTVDLAWSDASGSGNYTIQNRTRTFDGSAWGAWSAWSSLTTTEAATPYAATVSQDATYDKEYQYQIKRTSHSDTAYSASATVAVSSSAALTPPTLSTAEWDGGATTLTWTGGTGSGNYTIQRRQRTTEPIRSIWSSWMDLTTTESASPFDDTTAYAEPFDDMEYGYRVKRTTASDSYYSNILTVNVAMTG